MKYKYTNDNMKLLFKNYVKLTSQCCSNCSGVKEDLKLQYVQYSHTEITLYNYEHKTT